MGRKSNKQLIKEQLDNHLTISQLIEHLKGLPQDTFVGRVGHFGEAYLMDKHDFSYIREAYLTPSDFWCQENGRLNIQILDIYVPDIGPAPD